MQAILSVGVGLPLLFKPGFRWNSSRYSATGFWTPFSFILPFHSRSHFNQLISLLRLLFHTTPLNSTLGLERYISFLFDFVLGKGFTVTNKGRLNPNPLCFSSKQVTLFLPTNCERAKVQHLHVQIVCMSYFVILFSRLLCDNSNSLT